MIYLLLGIFVYGGFTHGVIKETFYKPPDNREILNKSLITFNNWTYNLTIEKQFLPDWYIETAFMSGKNIKSIDFTLGRQYSKYFRFLGGFKSSQLDLNYHKSSQLYLYFAIRHYNNVHNSKLHFMIDGRFIIPYSVHITPDYTYKMASVLYNMYLAYDNIILIGLSIDMFANHSKYARYTKGTFPVEERLYWPNITRGRYISLYMGIEL